MSKKKMVLGTLLLSAGMLASCGPGHVAVGYRSYDPYHSDYHAWNDREMFTTISGSSKHTAGITTTII